MVQPLDYHTVGCGGCPAAHPGLEPGHPVPEAGALPITLMGNERPSIHADTWQAPPAGFEPAILRLTAACSTKLSYGGITVPKNQVGMTGFEPATFCSQSRRATKLRYIPLKEMTEAIIVGVAGFGPA